MTPVAYETWIQQEEIQKDELKDLLLFPNNSIELLHQPKLHRTAASSEVLVRNKDDRLETIFYFEKTVRIFNVDKQPMKSFDFIGCLSTLNIRSFSRIIILLFQANVEGERQVQEQIRFFCSDYIYVHNKNSYSKATDTKGVDDVPDQEYEFDDWINNGMSNVLFTD